MWVSRCTVSSGFPIRFFAGIFRTARIMKQRKKISGGCWAVIASKLTWYKFYHASVPFGTVDPLLLDNFPFAGFHTIFSSHRVTLSLIPLPSSHTKLNFETTSHKFENHQLFTTMTASTTHLPTCCVSHLDYSNDFETFSQPAKSKQLNKSPFCPNVLVLSENRSVTSNVKSKIGPLDTSEGSESSIFIRKTVDGGWDESWTLKRANPVYDSDDEDFIVMNCSPPKKQRTTDLTLDSGNRLSNGNNGFPIKLQTHIC